MDKEVGFSGPAGEHDDIHWRVREFVEGLREGFHVLKIEGRTETRYLPTPIDAEDWVLTKQEVVFDVLTVRVDGPLKADYVRYQVYMGPQGQLLVGRTDYEREIGLHNLGGRSQAHDSGGRY